MSEYTKPCTTCKAEIRMSNNTGKWLPFNLDGSPHRCSTNGHITQKQESLSLEDRINRLEEIVLDPRK